MKKIPLYAALILAMGLYSAGTVKRNSLWLNEYAIWTDTLTKSPHWSRARVLLGNALFDGKLIDEAMAHYKTVIRIEEDAGFFGPAYHAAKQNLAIAYAEKSEYALKIKGDFLPAKEALRSYGDSR